MRAYPLMNVEKILTNKNCRMSDIQQAIVAGP